MYLHHLKIYEFLKTKKFFFNLFLAVLGLHCCSGFSLVVASGRYCSSRCAGFSLWWLLLLQSTGSRVQSFQQLQRMGWVVLLPDSRAWAQYLWHTGLVSRGHVETSWTRELEPVSSALVGRFLSTAPPGKCNDLFLKKPLCNGFSIT